MPKTHKWEELRSKMRPEVVQELNEHRDELRRQKALADLRTATGLTQQQLADALGINQGSVSKAENAEDMNISTLRRYVEAMGGRLRIAVDLPDGRTIELGDLGGKAA